MKSKQDSPAGVVGSQRLLGRRAKINSERSLFDGNIGTITYELDEAGRVWIDLPSGGGEFLRHEYSTIESEMK